MKISILTLSEASDRLQLQPDFIAERCAEMFCEHVDGPRVKTQPYLIALQDRTIVGALWTHRSKPDVVPFPEVIYIDMVIDEPFQKQGIGKNLIKTLKDLAREEGACEVWVLTEEKNTSARKLYSSFTDKEPSSELMYTIEL